MNQISQVMTTLLHYKVVVRDTLEYALPKDSYELNLYNEKKRSVLVELDENTPLRSILNNSGDNGKNLEKTIRDWYEEVYGEGSSITSVGKDGVRVDHAQHIAIYRGVVPIHENIEAMMTGINNDAKSKGIDVAAVYAADLAEEKLYRAVSYLTMVNDLVKLFNDYNQARREANGEETPASRFIGNDLGQVFGLVMQVRNNNTRITDASYMKVQDAVVALVEHMTGRRDLPQGKNFGQVMSETQQIIGDYVKLVEPEFRSLYLPLVNELIQQAKEQGNQITPDAKPASEETKPVELDETPLEIDPRTGMPKA
mgnify:FL=1